MVIRLKRINNNKPWKGIILVEQGETLRIEDNKRGFGEFFAMLSPFYIMKLAEQKTWQIRMNQL